MLRQHLLCGKVNQLHTYVRCKTGFPDGSVVKSLPAKQETRVQSWGWEDPMEEEMATHSSLLAWRVPWTEEPSGLVYGAARVRHRSVTKQQQQNAR